MLIDRLSFNEREILKDSLTPTEIVDILGLDIEDLIEAFEDEILDQWETIVQVIGLEPLEDGDDDE